MPLWFPIHFWWAVLKPICQRHVAVCKVDCVQSPLRSYRILLSEYKTHYFAELHVVQKELDVDRVGLILCRPIRFVVEEVVRGDHLYVGVFDVDAARATKGNCDRSVPGKQRPPYSLPEPFVCSTQLRALDTAVS